MSFAKKNQYPIKIEIIDKSQATYDTPENSYTAMISSLIKKDIGWYYETFTEESAAQNKQKFELAKIDPTIKFNTVKDLKDIFIISSIEYKTGMLIIVKTYDQSGTIIIGPSAFVMEGDKWKHTDQFSFDEELHEYMSFVPALFDGKGQKPADVNTFLAFAAPLQMKTELPPETSDFHLHIFYGVTIDPATFKAELNKQDISDQFNPEPVGDQVVKLNLNKGRNVLVLSIKGKKEDGKITEDRDRLVFIVN